MTKPRKSGSAIWRDALRDADQLDRTAKLVGFVLSTYLNRDCHAWPSRSTIAAGGSLTTRAVDLALGRLESAGFLSAARTKGGNNRTNIYTALVPSTANAVHRSEWARVNGATANGEREALNGERGSHESIESAESTRAAGLSGSGGALIEDDCMVCGKRQTLFEYLDRLLCKGCIVAEVRNLEHELGDHIADLRTKVAP